MDPINEDTYEDTVWIDFVVLFCVVAIVVCACIIGALVLW